MDRDIQRVVNQIADSDQDPYEKGLLFSKLATNCNRESHLTAILWAQAALRFPLDTASRIRMYEIWAVAATASNFEASLAKPNADRLSVVLPASLGLLEVARHVEPANSDGEITLLLEQANVHAEAPDSFDFSKLLNAFACCEFTLTLAGEGADVTLDTEKIVSALMRVVGGGAVKPTDYSSHRPHWVTEDASSYASFQIDLPEFLESMASFVDSAADEVGFMNDLLDSLKKDPNGPQIDIRNGLLPQLGDRVTVVSRFANKHVISQEEQILVAIEVKDAGQLTKIIHRAMMSDPDMRANKFENVSIGATEDDVTIWQNDEPEGVPLTAICVAGKHLFLATDVALLTDVLSTHAEGDSPGGRAENPELRRAELLHQNGLITDDALTRTKEAIRKRRVRQADD